MTDTIYSVQINIIEAKDLVPKDPNGLSDPYCKISVTNLSKKYKTHKIKKTLNPVWNESFQFDVKGLNDHDIHFRVMDWDKIGKDDPEGDVILSLSSLDFIGKEEATDMWLNLQNTESGSIHFTILVIEKSFRS